MHEHDSWSSRLERYLQKGIIGILKKYNVIILSTDAATFNEHA